VWHYQLVGAFEHLVHWIFGSACTVSAPLILTVRLSQRLTLCCNSLNDKIMLGFESCKALCSWKPFLWILKQRCFEDLVIRILNWSRQWGMDKVLVKWRTVLSSMAIDPSWVVVAHSLETTRRLTKGILSTGQYWADMTPAFIQSNGAKTQTHNLFKLHLVPYDLQTTSTDNFTRTHIPDGYYMLSYKGSIRSETWEASRSKKKQKKHVLACTLLIFDFAFFSFRVMLQVLFQNGNKLESLTNVVAHVLGSEGVYTVGTMVSNPRIP